MPKPTQAQKVLDYIRLTKGWIPAYRLVKVELLGKWIGTNGDRIARQWHEDGKILREPGGTLTGKDAFGKDIEAKYTYYNRGKPKSVEVFKDSEGVTLHVKPIW